MTGVVSLGPGGLSFAEVVAVARGDAAVDLSAEARVAMERSAAVVVARAASDEPAYGDHDRVRVARDRPDPAGARVAAPAALVRSHAAGMGPPVEREVVRAMMLLRARSLAMGCSGARPVVAERDPRPARTPRSRRSFPSTDRSGRAAISRRSRTARWR